jgi:hypothetical protein
MTTKEYIQVDYLTYDRDKAIFTVASAKHICIGDLVNIKPANANVTDSELYIVSDVIDSRPHKTDNNLTVFFLKLEKNSLPPKPKKNGKGK